MLAKRCVESGRWEIFLRALKIFVLPPLLTLAAVGTALMGLTDYQSRRGLQTTYVVRGMQHAGLCALCHDGTSTRPPLRLAAPVPDDGAMGIIHLVLPRGG